MARHLDQLSFPGAGATVIGIVDDPAVLPQLGEAHDYGGFRECVLTDNRPDRLRVVIDTDDDLALEEFSAVINATWKIAEHETRPVILAIDDVDVYVEAFIRESIPYPKRLSKISRKGRFRGLFLSMTTDRPVGLPTRLRENCTNWFVFHLTGSRDLKALSEKHIELTQERILKLGKHYFLNVDLLGGGTVTEHPPII